MPTYTVKDIKENQEWDVFCSYAKLQEMLDNNPDLIRVYQAPALISDSKSTLRRAGSGWQDVLGKIKKGSGKGNSIHD